MSIKPSVSSLDAVVLIAADFEGQVSFYRDVLGLELISQSSETAFSVAVNKCSQFSRAVITEREPNA